MNNTPPAHMVPAVAADGQPVDVAPELSVNLVPNGETVARRVIAGLTVTFGVSGLLLLPSGQFSGIELVIIGIGCFTTLPVALIWLVGPWPPRALAVPFIVYSDLGILAVLLAFDNHFWAMPGCALLSIVSVFVVVTSTTRVHLAHLAVSLSVLAVLAAVSIAEDVDPWMVASRAVTTGSLFASPFILQAYIHHLRRQAQGALHDPLTGLWNRRGLLRTVERMNGVGGSGVGTATIGVMVIDIDRFKDINDRFGHPSGDVVLTELATRLLQAAGNRSAVARLGGDEFVCVHLGTRADVDATEARILGALEEQFSGPPFTTSVGSACETIIRGESTHPVVRRLIARADIAMYRNKALPLGGARVRGSTGTRTGFGGVAIRDRIDDLILAGGPSIAFQPICKTTTGAVVGYEALARFPHGHGSPLVWFRDAVDAGVGQRLELAAIDRALVDMQSLPAHAFIALNASADTIRGADLLERLTPHLGTRTIYIEITEHERVDDYRAVAASVENLRKAGVLISVDDVGAGFSGLRQVVELAPDTLKVDYTLVHGIDTDPVRRAAAAALVSFARDTGSTLVMEGVETDGELQVAAELGADMVQGFLTGRPQPA